ncbi:MAG: hypothetical protein CM15mP83_4700 [Flavobacteriaceae bacterium]|nr:MAG: hypothetical protein CM15mP83_4700 [Flavobacteriaceae bacterium]
MYKNGRQCDMDVLFSKYEDVSEKFKLKIKNSPKHLIRIIKKEDAGESLTSRDKRSKRVAEINSRANSLMPII